MLSNGNPRMSSRLIMEFGEKRPVLWSITIRNLSECGFGTAWTGDGCVHTWEEVSAKGTREPPCKSLLVSLSTQEIRLRPAIWRA